MHASRCCGAAHADEAELRAERPADHIQEIDRIEPGAGLGGQDQPVGAVLGEEFGQRGRIVAGQPGRGQFCDDGHAMSMPEAVPRTHHGSELCGEERRLRAIPTGVEGDIVGEPGEVPQHGGQFGSGLRPGGGGPLHQADPEQRAGPPLPAAQRLERAGEIAAAGGDAADFHRAEAQPGEPADQRAPAVEACRQAQRGGEMEARRADARGRRSVGSDGFPAAAGKVQQRPAGTQGGRREGRDSLHERRSANSARKRHRRSTAASLVPA